MDLQVCADGWTLLLSCARDKTAAGEGAGGGGAGGHSSSKQQQSLVSLYHAKSGKSISFLAAAGCFRLIAADQSPQVR